MPSLALLSASLQYGIVSRSLPLNGKILPGYLDASGARLGLGVGNPNAEFSPNISACALSSDGGTAKVLWGFRHGEVALMTAPRAIDSARRPVTDLVRCDVAEEHEGTVFDVTWDDASGAIVASAGGDGKIKLWDSKTMQCLWASEKKAWILVSDAFLKVCVSISQGLVVAVTRSGEVALWKGFNLQSIESFAAASITEVRIPCPVVIMEPSNSIMDVTRDVSALYIDPHASAPTVLVAYEEDPNFYRLRVDITGGIETTTFGDASFGFISAIAPFFSPDVSFILTGDQLGCVNVYDWTAAPQSRSAGPAVQCVRKFEAHEDGAAVTALAWNGVTLVTGSARGTAHVWDALTFEHLRSFASPMPRIRGRGAGEGREREFVRQILLGPEKEVILVNVGDRVLAWKAGPVPRQGGGGVRGRNSIGVVGKKKKDNHGVAKYIRESNFRQTFHLNSS